MCSSDLRKLDEKIVIGGAGTPLPLVTVTVVEIAGENRVRLGIEAPRDVPVHRQEVYDRIEAARKTDQTEHV